MTALDSRECQRQASLRYKRYGTAFLTVPTLIVAIFAIGEGVGGEEGWWGHLIQLVLVAALFAVAWYVPKVGGPALIATAIAFGWWALSDFDDLAAELSALAIIALPVVIAGWFFTLVGYRDART